MKLRLAIATTALMICQGAFALTAAPQSCPTVEQLQAIGVTSGHKDPHTTQWMGYTASNTFGTSESWSLVVGEVDSQDEVNAMQLINAKIGSLRLLSGPEAVDQQGHYGCIYTNIDNSLVAVTVTPEISASEFFDQQQDRFRALKK